MRRVISISLCSSQRDFRAKIHFPGEEIFIERIGTNGSLRKARDLIKSLDGQVDGIGLGGINIYLSVEEKLFIFREGKALSRFAKVTPVLDGFFLKQAWEEEAINYLVHREGLKLKNKSVIFSSVLDRFVLATALKQAGAKILIGDALFGLKLPVLFNSLGKFKIAANVTMPLLRHLPISLLYPLGKRQNSSLKFSKKLIQKADILAGDFHFFRSCLPKNLMNKIFITSTLTSEDIVFLKNKGVRVLISTMPEINGRVPGANVWEAVLFAYAGWPLDYRPGKEEMLALLQKISFRPYIRFFY